MVPRESPTASPSRYWVLLHCESRSMTSTFWPRSAAMAARLHTIVVLPTPPF